MLTKLPKIAKITLFLGLCIPSPLSRCGDIEKKTGPKYLSLTFCHWNLNGLTAHDSIKISLLQAYVTQHNYDIISLSETFLNSSIDSSDTRILIDRYNLIIPPLLVDGKFLSHFYEKSNILNNFLH